MPLALFLSRLLLFTFVCAVLPPAVLGRTNVHIDDNNSMITYSPGDWILAEPNALDEGGNHMLTEKASATARFTFTGALCFPILARAELAIEGADIGVKALGFNICLRYGRTRWAWLCSWMEAQQSFVILSIQAGPPRQVDQRQWARR
ncbi:hypothetical protein BD779DRAFT_542115 [Infundibulicybe gibba]|nr:hypothetical protein BD779DRAFT_542115 [Infundibulicybe gibba]